jgi:predicted flavoprotein YhiN
MASSQPIIVVGAGAAGMMAAGRAAELGARVLLLEKMDRPGKKILITGKGRCNLSNSRDIDSFIAQFGPHGGFLRPVFKRFFRDDLLALLRRYGIECRILADGKVYPLTDNARDIVRAFQHYLEDGKVALRTGVNVTSLLMEKGRVSGVSTTTGNLPAAAVIIATGGLSHPQTGSTGDGFRIAAELGHTIVRLRPGLVPLVAANFKPAKPRQVTSLRNVRVTAFQCPAEKIDPSLVPDIDVGRGLAVEHPEPPIIESRTGDAIIVPFGLSGPVILQMSLAIIDALESGPVSVSIDLLPQKDRRQLQAELQSSIDRSGRLTFQDIIREFLPPRLVKPFIALTGVPPGKLSSQLTLSERELTLDRLKSLRFDIQGPYSMSAATVTAGGISLPEIDPLTMESRLVRGLFFCGEILDLDAGTGGYNLQAAFSTGYVAGESAASRAKAL